MIPRIRFRGPPGSKSLLSRRLSCRIGLEATELRNAHPILNNPMLHRLYAAVISLRLRTHVALVGTNRIRHGMREGPDGSLLTSQKRCPRGLGSRVGLARLQIENTIKHCLRHRCLTHQRQLLSRTVTTEEDDTVRLNFKSCIGYSQIVGHN